MLKVPTKFKFILNGIARRNIHTTKTTFVTKKVYPFLFHFDSMFSPFKNDVWFYGIRNSLDF
jgi:hypothetical protein